MVADGHTQQLGHFFCQSFAVSAPDCIKQRAAVPCLCTIVKPFAYSGFKNFPNLCIGNDQRRAAIRQRIRQICITHFGQIARQIQHTPKIFLRGVQIIVGQVFFNMLDNGAASHQRFELRGDIVTCIVDKRTDNSIIAGVFPIAFGFLCYTILEISQIADHVPRTINVCIAKMVTVVPCLDFSRLRFKTGIFQHLIYICLCKAKGFAQPGRKNRVRNKIVRPGKNAFFGNFQTAGNNSKVEGDIVFERGAHHSPHHVQHLRIISVAAGFCNGNIVLIQNDDRRLFEMDFQHPGQQQKAAFGFIHRCSASQNPLKDAFVIVRNSIVIQKKLIILKCKCQLHAQHSIGAFKGQTVRVLEREKDHRTLVHPFFAKFCVLGNRQSLKQLLAVFGDVQKICKSAHTERFSETTRASNQVDFRNAAIQNLCNQIGLINIVISFGTNL